VAYESARPNNRATKLEGPGSCLSMGAQAGSRTRATPVFVGGARWQRPRSGFPR
jgi:hypothetical protein